MDPAPAQLLEPAAPWANPIVWLCRKRLSRGFWTFFTAALFFDFGFAVYFFLFNLYLLDLHFDERTMGLVGGALTLGSVAGTLPAGLLARRIGIRPLLIVCFIAAPVLGVARTFALWQSAQIGLAFLAGLAMCLWGVCFLPAVAGLTSHENRASGFSLIFSASIGTSTLGGVLCGYLPQWLARSGVNLQPAEVKRLMLLASCAIAAIGLLAVLRMDVPLAGSAKPIEDANPRRWRQVLRVDPFLLRFLPAMALWTAISSAFTPFANVYLSRNLDLPLSSIGVVFSASQILQLGMGLLTPVLFRVLGLINGIAATQVLSGLALAVLAGTHNSSLAVSMYLGFSVMRWMSSPGLYNLVMSRVPEQERSTAASMTLFCNAVLLSPATAGAGILFARFGYPHVLAGIAAATTVAAIVFHSLVRPLDTHETAQPLQVHAGLPNPD